MDENLEWLTQKPEDPKSNKGNLTYPPHTVNVEVATHPPISTLIPPFQVYPPFLAKTFCTPSSDSIFGRSYPLHRLLKRWGRSNYVPHTSIGANILHTTMCVSHMTEEKNSKIHEIVSELFAPSRNGQYYISTSCLVNFNLFWKSAQFPEFVLAWRKISSFHQFRKVQKSFLKLRNCDVQLYMVF